MSLFTSSFKRYFYAFAVIFVAGGFLFCVATELVVRVYVAPGHPVEAQKKAFHAATTTTAVFGDSRAVSGIVAEPGLANFSDTGDNAATMLVKAESYAALGNAKNIIIQAAPHQFALYRLMADQSDRLAYFLDPADRFLVMLRPQFRRYLFQYWATIFQDPARLLRMKSAAVEPEMVTKFSDLPFDQQVKKSTVRVNLHRPVKGFSAMPEARRFRDVISRLMQRGIRVCLVSYPVSSAYRKAAAASPIFAEIHAWFGDLAELTGARYADFSAAYGDDLFSDTDHLNRYGAAVLTGDIKRACRGDDRSVPFVSSNSDGHDRSSSDREVR